MIDVDSVTPIGTNVLIRKCGIGEDIGDGKRGLALGNGEYLELSTNYHQQTNWVELIAVGNDCKIFRPDMTARYRGFEGETTWCPEMLDPMVPLDDDLEYWEVDEEDLVPAIFDIKDTGEMRILPLTQHIAIEIAPDVEGYGDIALQEESAKMASEGTVMAVGPGRVSKKNIIIPPQVKEGQVVFWEGEIQAYEMDGKNYTILPEDRLVGIKEQ